MAATTLEPMAGPPVDSESTPAEPVIRLDHATKRYRRVTGEGRIRQRRVDHVALDAINLSITAGETVGVLGHNGAGKTTLLRLLAGVTRPSGGRIRVVGRIAPLISVGVGFHQELSGRENVLVNGMLLGLTRKQVHERLDSIVAFSELVDVLDTPVKFYSSGMMMRLAFSVAMHVDPDVLLVDEVLAVGDLAFQLKCLEKMKSLQRKGTTIVLVSHSVHAVRLLCPRAIVLDHGRLLFDGPSTKAVAAYNELLGQGAVPDANHRAELLDRHLVDDNGALPGELRLGDRYRLRFRLVARDDIEAPTLRFAAIAETGVDAYERLHPMESLAAGEERKVEIGFTAAMAGGTFRLAVSVLDAHGELVCDDGDGAVVYRAPEAGSYGYAELDAAVAVGGHVINDHRPVTIGDPDPQ